MSASRKFNPTVAVFFVLVACDAAANAASAYHVWFPPKPVGLEKRMIDAETKIKKQDIRIDALMRLQCVDHPDLAGCKDVK